MPAQIQSTPDAIVKGIKQAFIDSGLYNAQTCIVSLPPDTFPLAGPPMLIISPGDWGPAEPQVRGGGKYVSGLRGLIHFRVLDQRLTDVADQDFYRLIDMRYSLIRLAEKTIAFLALYIPYDAAGNALSEEPMRLSGAAAPVQTSPDPEEWAEIAWDCEIAIQAHMTAG
jgi:hypothetical protein